MLNQSTWRKAGAVTIALEALMAAYAVGGGVLRDSAIHVARLISEEASGQVAAGRPLLFCLVYWLIFGLLILISLYLAVLDVRFIRFQYALEKKALFKQSLRDADARRDRGEADKNG